MHFYSDRQCFRSKSQSRIIQQVTKNVRSKIFVAHLLFSVEIFCFNLMSSQEDFTFLQRHLKQKYSKIQCLFLLGLKYLGIVNEFDIIFEYY